MKNSINLKQVDKKIIDYLKVLIHKKKMDKLPAEILSKILLDLYVRFEKVIFLSVMGKLNQEGMKQFDQFVESHPTPKESQVFLKKHVTDYNEVIKQVMVDFEKSYLNEE